MKISKGLGTLALMALSVGASWVLLAPDAVPPAAAAQAKAPAAHADGQGFSVLAWPQPALQAPQPPAATAPERAALPPTPAPELETDPMELATENDTAPR